MTTTDTALTVRASLLTAAGDPSALRAGQITLPAPGPRDLLIRLHAAGINPVDYKLARRGTLGGTLPAVLGWDGAGVVERVGPAVTRFRVGDAVHFCSGGFGPRPGTFAEAAVVDERFVAHKPQRLSFVEAAAAPLVTITAWEALHGRARIYAGARVLVQGLGGVGHIGAQLARIAGANVAATVGGARRMEFARGLGVEHPIDYRGGDVAKAVHEWSPDGADIVFDTVGGRTFGESFALTTPYGDLVSCVETSWDETMSDTFHERNLRVSFTWMPAPQVFGWDAAREAQTRILEDAAALFDSGALRVVVGRTFSLSDAGKALAALEAGGIDGKVVLTIA
jgi:NADPH:quinone reductase